MSYILDALKRADAERGRGAVPGLHTRQLPNPNESHPAAPGARSALWLGVAAALALAGIAGGLWLWQRPAAAPLAVVVQPVVAAAPASAALAPPVVPIAPEKPAALTATPAKTVAPVANVRIKAKPEPTRAAPAVATPLPVPAPPKTPAKAAPVAKPAAPAAPASTTVASVPLLSELPDALRRQVPTISITGAVYAENPAQRLLLVNNLVLTQGTLAAPEVKLEEIQARSSIFSFRGTRFRVAH